MCRHQRNASLELIGSGLRANEKVGEDEAISPHDTGRTHGRGDVLSERL
jgi:hypothetical protein